VKTMIERRKVRRVWLVIGGLLALLAVLYVLVMFLLANFVYVEPSNLYLNQTANAVYATNTWVQVQLDKTDTARGGTKQPGR
jgi:hypothetical protein